MKDVLLINNRSASTGIGNYSYTLFEHLSHASRKEMDFMTLQSPAEDNYGQSIKIFTQKVKRMVDHLGFICNVPSVYKIYHILNPNLGILLHKCRPAVVTVFDIAAMVPMVGREIIAESHGLDIPMLTAMKINMRFIRNADMILCMSKHTRRDLVSLLGIEKSRIVVGYPGIDLTKYRPADKSRSRAALNLPQDREIILNIGVDEPRKNIRTLLRAFHFVRKRFPKAILVRIGGMRESSRRLISALGMDQAVVHCRKVSSVTMFYNAADVFAFPSYYEGFGFPAAEAMASGCPVIAGDSSSLPEVVGDAGILHPPFDAARLAESISDVLANSNLQSAMRSKGLERVKMFSWEACVQQTLRTYESLCS